MKIFSRLLLSWSLVESRILLNFGLFVCFCLHIHALALLPPSLAFSLSCINEGKENQGTQFPPSPRTPNQSVSSLLVRLLSCT